MCSRPSSSPSSKPSSSGLFRAWIAREWPWIAIGTLLLCTLLVQGCGSGRTVLVSEASPLRIGPNVKGKVYQMIDGEWTLSTNRVSMPEGWYLVPPSFVHPDSGGEKAP